MTQQQYAQHRKVDPAYISRMKTRGIIVMRGKFVDVAASDAVLDDRVVDVDQVPITAPPFEPPHATPPVVPPPATTPGAADTVAPQRTVAGGYAAAKTVEMTCKARLRKLELDRAEGRVLDAAIVRDLLAVSGRALRDGLLGLPDRLAPTLAAETDQARVRELLRGELIRELDGLANVIDRI